MSIIIDGYNLLHVFGVLGDQQDPRALERARWRLLNRLADAMPLDLLTQTTIVFDAKTSPRGAESSLRYRGIQVLFAVNYDEADDLIEELIQKSATPKKLVVVSSDHRIKTAASRRDASPVDSEIWFDGLRPVAPEPTGEPSSGKPSWPQSPDEIAAWVAEFGSIGELASDAGDSSPVEPFLEELANPFPPGYAEDLLEEEEFSEEE